MQVWDTEMGGLKTEIVGNKAFFSLSYSEENRSLLATGADRSIRLYDPRATEGNLVKTGSKHSRHQWLNDFFR